MRIEAKVAALGLVLPAPLPPPPGHQLPFAWVRVRGQRAYISGHGPQNPDDSLGGPLGKVGGDVTEAQAYQAARLTALAILGSLKRELGDLDRVSPPGCGWRGASTWRPPSRTPRTSSTGSRT